MISWTTQWNKTKPITSETLLDNAANAENSGNPYRINAAYSELDAHRAGIGCEVPTLALLACLYLFPQYVSQVMEVLPKPEAFIDLRERALYTAMLAVNGTSHSQWWPRLYHSVVLLKCSLTRGAYLDFTRQLLTTEFNVVYLDVYTAMVKNQALHNTLQHAAACLVTAQDIPTAIDKHIELLAALRARI